MRSEDFTIGLGWPLDTRSGAGNSEACGLDVYRPGRLFSLLKEWSRASYRTGRVKLLRNSANKQ